MIEDYFEVIEHYKIYEKVSNNAFLELLNEMSNYIFVILKFKKLSQKFDDKIKQILLNKDEFTEFVLSVLLKETDAYLPKNLTMGEILSKISDYIESPKANPNILEKIVNFPTHDLLIINPKIRLAAKRKMKVATEKLFSNGGGTRHTFGVSFRENHEEIITIEKMEQGYTMVFCATWIENNLDYATLLNNFIYLFGLSDDDMLLNHVYVKSNDTGLISNIYTPKGKHLFPTSLDFKNNEMMADLILYSYYEILSYYNIRIESLIDWFFSDYLVSEFNIENFTVKIKTESNNFFEKCKLILPELDRILKQFNFYVEENEIDPELIQMISASTPISLIKSMLNKKYIYLSSNNQWVSTAVNLLFQSNSLSYFKDKTEKKSFFEYLNSYKLKIDDFENYQIQALDWLIDHNIIEWDEDEYLEIADYKLIYILKKLNEKEVIAYHHCNIEIQNLIDKLLDENELTSKNSLLSENEHNMFDYYLNQFKYTNGPDLRNKYLHGTNSFDESQNQRDYFTIMRLIVLTVIKINDDLSTKFPIIST